MDEAKQRRLIESGWRIGGAADFLGLSAEELLEIERRLKISNEPHVLDRSTGTCYIRGMDLFYAVLNITYAGGNGENRDPVPFDSTDDQIRQIATEAVRGSSVPGIPAAPNANFTDFVVDRFPATEEQPNRLFLRSKTPFGGV